MKRLLKVLFFLLAIFQSNISEAKVIVFYIAVSEINFVENVVESKNKFTAISENDFGIIRNSESELVDYRNFVLGLKANAAKGVSNVAVQFGKTQNQISHVFRHTDALGLDRTLIQSSVQTHFKTVSSQVVVGKPFNQIIELGGQRIQYTAFKLSDGTFNIGRINGVK